MTSCVATDVYITWKPIKNASSYDVTCLTESGLSMFRTVDSTQYVIENATPGKKYIVTIQARDNTTNKSEPSIPLFIEISKTNNIIKLKKPEPTYKLK